MRPHLPLPLKCGQRWVNLDDVNEGGWWGPHCPKEGRRRNQEALSPSSLLAKAQNGWLCPLTPVQSPPRTSVSTFVKSAWTPWLSPSLLPRIEKHCLEGRRPSFPVK